MILLITIVTFYKISLYWCAIPVLMLCMLYWVLSDNHSSITKPIKKLPYGVLFFGMSFFIFAEAFSGTTMFESTIKIISSIEQNPIELFTLGTIGSGILVNIFNDIPASALIAQLLSEITFEENLIRVITYQAILSGLNIGKYLTQIGALAGILWFSIINIENKKQKNRNPNHSIRLPKRTELVKYGIANFTINGMALILIFIIQYYIIKTVIL